MTEWGQAHDRMGKKNNQEFSVMESKGKMWKEDRKGAKITGKTEKSDGKQRALETIQKVGTIWGRDDTKKGEESKRDSEKWKIKCARSREEVLPSVCLMCVGSAL